MFLGRLFNSNSIGNSRSLKENRAQQIAVKNWGQSYTTSTKLTLAQGCIVLYVFEQTLEHWGVHIGGGYVVSKYNDDEIKLHHVSDDPWKNCFDLTTEESYKLALAAAREFDSGRGSRYHVTKANCQHWVKDLADSVEVYCPKPTTVLEAVSGLVLLNVAKWMLTR